MESLLKVYLPQTATWPFYALYTPEPKGEKQEVNLSALLMEPNYHGKLVATMVEAKRTMFGTQKIF